MQNRYVADIGDYVKFAILRTLAFDRNLGVVWWLFPDEHHNEDGGHREYLERPNEWRKFDPDLFDGLLDVEKRKERNVHAIEEATILPNTVFVPDPVPCDMIPFSLRPMARKNWLDKVKTKLKDCSLVFLDPDNGIASENLRPTQRRAGKSVTAEEIRVLQEGDRTTVVYHHQSRFKGGHSSEKDELTKRLTREGLRVSGALRASPWSARLFFIINGSKELHDRADCLAQQWHGKITWHPNVES